MTTPLYLDYAATTPMAAQAVIAMTNCLSRDGAFANPASQHGFGEQAYQRVEQARADMAALLSCKAHEIIFTASATEANNLAIKGIALSYAQKGKHIVTSATEHPSVLNSCRYLESLGFSVTYLRPNSEGRLTLEQILAALTEQTILVSLMHVNNETGVICDIEHIAKALNDKNIFFHVDAAQSAGKLAIDLANTPVDLLSLSAHKFYGPKGAGCLVVRHRKHVNLTPLLHGGGQEYGLRSGTLATHQIVGMASAFHIAHQRLVDDTLHCQQLAWLLIEQLKALDGVQFNGCQSQKVPHILNVSFADVSADSLLIALRNDVAIASGSACHSGAVEASPVLRAMGIEGDRLYGAVRISFGRCTSEADIKQAGQRLCAAVTRLRQLALC